VVDLHGGIYSVTKRMKSCHLQQHEWKKPDPERQIPH
jgi:hypothetical protein